MKINTNTSPHIIFYFDVLGYKDIIKNGTVDENYIFHAIKTITSQIKGYSKDTGICKSLLFSDNCVICFPFKDVLQVPHLFMHSVLIAQYIQRNMLLHGLFIRGSICIGKIYINNSYIFGEGIIDAYTIENEFAIYPRIVVDNKLLDITLEYLNDVIKEGKYIKPPEKMIYPKLIDSRNMFNLLYKLAENPLEPIQFYNSIKVRKDSDSQYFVDVLQNVFSEYDIKDIKQVDLSKKCLLENYRLTHNILYGTDNVHITDINLCLCIICTRVLNGLESNTKPSIKDKYLWFCKYIDIFFKEIGLKEPFASILNT